VQPHQIAGGPNWLDVNEYDVEARSAGPASREQLRQMLQKLLTERFRIAWHPDTRPMRVYELVVDKNGPKIQPVKDDAKPGSWRFRGDMRKFAGFLSIQLTIAVPADPTRPGIAGGSPVPVVDKTGLEGIYEINPDLKMEPGADSFALWQRVLQDKLGLKLESKTEPVGILVIDSAERTPAAN
jgi:uncharacterized protein (TIGR03435 family)